MKHWKYLSYVVRHKWFVMVEAWRLGVFWRGLVHDLSKFLPREWMPYADYFYGNHPKLSELHGDMRNQYGGKFREQVKEEFDRAWLHHQRSNQHHWQYWVLSKDDGSEKIIEMPAPIVREMVADWKGAGRAINPKAGPSECRDWYLANKHKMRLHENTRAAVEWMLGIE